MRDELRYRMNAHLRQERNLILKVGVLLTLLFSLGYLAWALPYEPPKTSTGTLRFRVASNNWETLERTLWLEVVLDDGRYAWATATFRQWPAVGSRIQLREETNVFGFRHYYWDGLTSEPDPPTKPIP
jgi:hypothetical protein